MTVYPIRSDHSLSYLGHLNSAPHVPLTLREEPAAYLAAPHAGDGATGEPPTLARSWAACPFCGGSGRVAYTEPHPDTGERVAAEEPCEMCDGLGYPPPFAEPHVVYGVPFPLGRLVATPPDGRLGRTRRGGPRCEQPVLSEVEGSARSAWAPEPVPSGTPDEATRTLGTSHFRPP